jgi:L-ascorbate metabolism protein UlaG (beta-lactamase superfamily)
LAAQRLLLSLIALVFSGSPASGFPASDTAAVFTPATSSTRELLRAPLEVGEAILWHLYHSGFALKTANHLLIFDYWPGEGSPDESGGLAAGLIRPDEIKDENVVVFISHEHHDHWYRDCVDWTNSVERIHYIVSPEVSRADERYRSGQGLVTTIAANQSAAVGDIEVTTLLSTDSGVAFLIHTDGLVIYHSGDHASWNWRHDRDADTEFVTQRLRPLDDERIDIAMHVCDPRLKSSGWGGFVAFAERYVPALLVPMHMKGKYDETEEMASILEKHDVQVSFWPVRSRGDCILFRRPRND